MSYPVKNNESVMLILIFNVSVAHLPRMQLPEYNEPMQKASLFLIILYLMTACAPTPTPEAPAPQGPTLLNPEENAFAPQSTDGNLQKAGVVLDSINLAQDQGDSRTVVMFNGSMPSPCHELRIEVKAPSLQYEVFVKVYSVLRPDLQCDNVLRQFDSKITLGKYTAGVYSLWVNGQRIGDFVAY